MRLHPHSPPINTERVTYTLNQVDVGIEVFDFYVDADLEAIARRHGFEPFYNINERPSQSPTVVMDPNARWMNAGVLFTDQTIGSNLMERHTTGMKLAG